MADQFLEDWWARRVAMDAAGLRYRPEYYSRATDSDPTVAGAFFAVDSLLRALYPRGRAPLEKWPPTL